MLVHIEYSERQKVICCSHKGKSLSPPTFSNTAYVTEEQWELPVRPRIHQDHLDTLKLGDLRGFLSEDTFSMSIHYVANTLSTLQCFKRVFSSSVQPLLHCDTLQLCRSLWIRLEIFLHELSDVSSSEMHHPLFFFPPSGQEHVFVTDAKRIVWHHSTCTFSLCSKLFVTRPAKIVICAIEAQMSLRALKPVCFDFKSFDSEMVIYLAVFFIMEQWWNIAALWTFKSLSNVLGWSKCQTSIFFVSPLQMFHLFLLLKQLNWILLCLCPDNPNDADLPMESVVRKRTLNSCLQDNSENCTRWHLGVGLRSTCVGACPMTRGPVFVSLSLVSWWLLAGHVPPVPRGQHVQSP